MFNEIKLKSMTPKDKAKYLQPKRHEALAPRGQVKLLQLATPESRARSREAAAEARDNALKRLDDYFEDQIRRLEDREI